MDEENEVDELSLTNMAVRMEFSKWIGYDGQPIAGPSGIVRSDSEVNSRFTFVLLILRLYRVMTTPSAEMAHLAPSRPLLQINSYLPDPPLRQRSTSTALPWMR